MESVRLESRIGLIARETYRGTASGLSPAAARPFATVRVETELAEVLNLWADLENAAPCSIYQTRRWLVPWIETQTRCGRPPVYLVGRDAAGVAVAFLPLGIRRAGGFSSAHFLGGAHANINMGLFHPGRSWSRADVRALLVEAALASRPKIDCFLLLTQPLVWDGIPNPLAALPHGRSSDFGGFGELDRNAQAVIDRGFSAEALRKLRKKARRLEAKKGPIRHVRASDAASAQNILAAFVRQKAAGLRAKGVGSDFDNPDVRAFIERATIAFSTDDEPGIELHALYAGDRIAATFGGGGHKGRFSGMFNAFDADDIEVARSSPGDLLMIEIVKAKCREGYATFDLGVGAARYKAHYCGNVEPMIDAIVAVTSAGAVIGGLAALQRRAAGAIKRNRGLWRIVKAVRAARGRTGGSTVSRLFGHFKKP